MAMSELIYKGGAVGITNPMRNPELTGFEDLKSSMSS